MVPQIVRQLLLAGAFVALANLLLPVVRAEEANYLVGVAKIDITPDYPIRLHGFGHRRTESQGIAQRIWAKALAISANDEKPVVLLTVDNLGIRLAVVEEVAARLNRKAGIDRQRFVVTFTHTHSAPKTTGSADTLFAAPILPDQVKRIDRYTAELTNALEKVALQALDDRKPGRLERGIGKVEFARNRRTRGGPVDHGLPMLVVRNPTDRAIRATYVTYACHCVTLEENRISGDWAGYAQELIERNHPGAIALVSIGCGSDADPKFGPGPHNIAVATEQGEEIATEVDRLLQGPLKPVTGSISATLNKIELPLAKLPTRAELEKLAEKKKPDELEQLAARGKPEGACYNAQYQFAKLDRGESLQSAIDYPVQTLVFGNSLAMVFLSGEVCVDYSHRLKREFDAGRLWLHGYSNDFCAYIPSERLVLEGGYGGGAETVYFSLPSPLKAGLENKIVAEVHRQLPDEFEQPPLGHIGATSRGLSPADSMAPKRMAKALSFGWMRAARAAADPIAIAFGRGQQRRFAGMREHSRGANEVFDQTGQLPMLAVTDGRRLVLPPVREDTSAE